MSFGAYLVGAAELAIILGSLGFGARRVRRRLLPGWRGAPARLAEIVIAAAALVVLVEVLGVLQIFAPLPLLVCAVVIAIGTHWIPAGDREAGGPVDPGQGRPVLTWVAVAAAFLVIMHWATVAQESFSIGMYEGDSQWYHLPFPATFAQEDSLTGLHYFTRSYLAWFHPLNSELFHAVGMQLFDRDILSPWLNLVWLTVGLLAGWCIGRPFGAAPLTLAATALAFDLPVFSLMQPGSAMSDAFGLVFLLAAIALLVNATEWPRRGAAPGTASGAAPGEGNPANRARGRSDPDPAWWRSEAGGPSPGAVLPLAGLAAGLAAGGKIVFLPPVAVLAAGMIWLAPASRRVATAVLFLGGVLATGGFWYLRNAWYAWNPLPYVSEVGPIDLPGPDQGLNAGPTNSVAHYLTDGTVWSDWFLPGLHGELGPAWYLLVAAACLGVVLALVQGRSRLLRVIGAATVVAFLFYLFAPAAAEGPEGMPVRFRSGLRVFEPPLALGLVLAAVAAARLQAPGRIAALAAAAIAILLATDHELDFWGSGGELVGAILIAAALLLVPVWLALMRSRRYALATGGLVAVLAVALAWPQTDDYLKTRYRTGEAPDYIKSFGLEPVYDWASDLEDERIATTGILQYGLYGEDLSNRVRFMGIETEDHSYKQITDCSTWRRALNGGDYDYAVAMPPFGGKKAPERRWSADSASSVVLTSGPITVFRIDGELDPAACGRRLSG